MLMRCTLLKQAEIISEEIDYYTQKALLVMLKIGLCASVWFVLFLFALSTVSIQWIRSSKKDRGIFSKIYPAASFKMLCSVLLCICAFPQLFYPKEI